MKMKIKWKRVRDVFLALLFTLNCFGISAVAAPARVYSAVDSSLIQTLGKPLTQFISPYDYSHELPITMTFADLNFSDPVVKQALKVSNDVTKLTTAQSGRSKFSMNVDGATIDIYTVQPDDEKTRPAILYCHGGGFMFPLTSDHLERAQTFMEKTGARVFLPEYRCAPDDPFPTPFEDCYKTYLYMLNHAEELHIDPNKIIAYGDSAGGDLAAAVCQKARDEKIQAPAAQMLIYPVTDNAQNTKSLDEYAYGSWSKSANEQMWDIYLKNGDYGKLQYAAPNQAKDFSNLPQAYVEPCEMDALRDEGIAYANNMKAAGVPVTLNIVPGAYHGYDGQVSSPLTKREMEVRINYMNTVFNS